MICFTALTDSEVVSISAHAINPQTQHYGRNDNFVATFGFADGSVASLTYTALGHSGVPKEMAEIYTDGKIIEFNDFKSLRVHGADQHALQTRQQDKGLFHEMQSFAQGIKQGKWPIPLWQQYQVSDMAFTVERLLLDS